ncbi:MAG: FAD-binding oxidoreductase [Rhodoferax sp.]
MDAQFLAQLRSITGEQGVLSGDDVAARSTGYVVRTPMRATHLVRPRNTAEVSALLKLAHAARQSVVTHGGRSGLVHGADTEPGELILSLERMNQIEEIDPVQRIAQAQAGVVLQTLQEAVATHELAFPLDLGARGSATLGGIVATNAGGNRVIRYGMTRAMVLGVEAVLADGTVVSSLNRMIKNNAGYDLKQLFIGSEGTLGVVTRVVLRLFERPRSEDVALVGVDSFSQLAAFLKQMDRALGGGLSAFEVMWREFYVCVTTAPALSAPPLPASHPFYVLVEAQGSDAERDAARFSQALQTALETGLIANATIAQSARERSALWALRDDVGQLARHGPPFVFDVSLPIGAMEAYLAGVRASLAQRWPEHHCWVFGHLGDGNLHLVIRAGDAQGSARSEVEGLVYRPLQAIGGSVSAEHGIGLEKKPYLHLSRNPAEVALMQSLKRTLDPHNILNPGKVLP